MAWPFSKATNWPVQEGPTTYATYPVDADTRLLAGMPAGFNAASAPVNCIRPGQVSDKFAGIVTVDSDNTLANYANPNILNSQNFGDGTTGPGGCKAPLIRNGVVILDARAPNDAGVPGGPTGFVGDQSDVDRILYYNGTGFTNIVGATNLLIGKCVEFDLSGGGGPMWKIHVRSDVEV